MYLIGITGFIGSGKTTIGYILKDLGYVVFDMDKWCSKFYKDQKFIKLIKENFPNCFEEGIFNKKKLRSIVFSNRQALEKLEKLTHPYLKRKLMNFIHKNRFNQNICFIETALLYQMNLAKYFSDIIITEAPYNVILERTVKRDCIIKDEFDYIIKRQQTDMFNDKKAYKINTNKPLSHIKTDIIKLIERI